MDKPFVFGVAVDDVHFVGREKETRQLYDNFKYGVNTILMSPRRMGKTSLVKKVSSLFGNGDIVIVHLDIFSCRSEYDFLNMFAAAILQQTSSRIEEWKQNAQEFLSRISPKINFSPDPTQEFSVSLGISPRTHRPEEVLNLPETIAMKKGCHIIVCIDEFQQVGEFPDSLSVQKRMRTVWQHQKNVSYCLYGSKKNMMMALFQQRSRPFFKFGSTMILGNIPVSDWVPYLCARFSIAGKELPKDIAAEICRKVELHSSYVQELAFNTLLCTREHTASQAQLDEAFENLLDENTPYFQSRLERLTTFQMNFIRAINSGVHNDFGKANVRDEFNLGSSSNIVRIKDALLDKELIEIRDEGVFLTDPVMGAWLTGRLRL